LNVRFSKGDDFQYYDKQPGERSGLKSALILFQHKGQEVEVETMRLRLEPLAEEPKVGAVEGRQIDQILTEMNQVKELVDVVTVRMVMEEGESEDAAMTVHEESPEEGEVRNRVRYGHAL